MTVAQTQIAAVRATATVNADRLMVTLENAQTAVGNVDLQSTRIAATLIAQGMPFVDASEITPVIPTAAPQSDNGSADPADRQPAADAGRAAGQQPGQRSGRQPAGAGRRPTASGFQPTA